MVAARRLTTHCSMLVRENDSAELLGEAQAELAAYRDHVQCSARITPTRAPHAQGCKQFATAMANASDNPKRMTAEEWCDAVFEFEELEYELAAAICEFVYYEVEKWDEIESQETMARIEAVWDRRAARWKAHPDELTQRERMDFFRRGVGDARKAGVLVK